MQHPQFAKLMASQMMDGSISEQDRTQLMRHLATCDHCLATWEQLQQVDRQFKAGIVVAPSLGFARKLEDSIASLPPRRAQGLLSPGHKLGLLVAPIVILCTSLLMTISTLWHQPVLLVQPLLVQLPRLISVIHRILHSGIMQQWSLALRSMQSQLQGQLHNLTQMSAWQTVLIGYLVTAFLLGLAGLYLLNRMNLQPSVLASRSS